MKYTAATTLSLASLVAVALAQNETSSAADPAATGATGGASNYTAGLLAALQGAELTTLATVLQGFPQIGSMLEMGGNFTVFAPNNDALAPLLSNASSVDPSQIQNILSYHIAPGTLPVSALGMGMNHTIAPTLLQAPLLGDNQTQPLVLSIGMDGSPRVRTLAQNVTVLGNTTYQNLLVHVVNELIMPPMNLTATVGAANLTALAGALTTVSAELPAMLAMTPRVTIFAPIDSAFANISQTLTTLNVSQIQTVLTNHIINGTVAYSTDLAMNGSSFISAAGQPFTLSMMNGTAMIMSGSMASARLVRTDIPIENGVVHLIDSVLANTEMNMEAAQSAASSYAAEATAATTGMAGVAPAAAGNGVGFRNSVAGFSLAGAMIVGGLALLL